MPKDKSGLSLSKIATAVIVLIAAFLLIKFVFSFVKWIVIAGLAVFVAWLFLRGDSSGSRDG